MERDNEEAELKAFSNELRELAKDHPVVIPVTPIQREELSEKEIEEYWQSVIDESKKRYPDMLLFPPETVNEILQNCRDEERRKERYFEIQVLKRRENNYEETNQKEIQEKNVL